MSNMLLDAFIWRALIAGILIAACAGVVGSFVIWRKMAYFGDSLAHSALLGVALGVLFGISSYISILLTSLAFAVLLLFLQQLRTLTTDTLLGVLSHVSLSLGLVVLSIFAPYISIESYLFGDILSVDDRQIYWIALSCCLLSAALVHYWQPLLLITISEDLARAEGVSTIRMHWIFTFLITLLVAVSIHIVGVLLITSLLIIPAASARQLMHTPVAMFAASGGFGVLAVVGGILASAYLDTPSGPSIVLAAAVLFVVSFGIKLLRQSR